MEIPEQQIKELKEQIINQIESTFPEDKKEDAIQRVNSMNKEEFLEFLKKNKLIKSENEEETSDEEQNIASNSSPFRLIVEGKMPSYLIEDDKDAMAVLEINPISKGHVIIIPKIPVLNKEKIPKTILAFAKKISNKLAKELKPKEVLISPSIVLQEIIINLLPVYSNETINSPKKQASKEELEELKSILEEKPKIKQVKKPEIKKIEESKMWFPKRIP